MVNKIDMTGDRRVKYIFPLCGYVTPYHEMKGGGILAKKQIQAREKKEIRRLNEIYQDLPSNQFAVAQGLIIQAARLRIRLDQLWEDIQEHGETEQFTQSEKTEPYERERPAARLFTATDKNYQAIIKQVNELTPPEKKGRKLEKLMSDG